MRKQTKATLQQEVESGLASALRDDERFQAATAEIERLRAEMRLDSALAEIERAADMLLFAARTPQCGGIKAICP
jgi:hypothetical protein